MVANRPNFSEETLVLPIPKPYYFKSPRSKEETLVKAVKIRRLYGPDLTKVRSSLQAMRASGYVSGSLSFLPLCKAVLDVAVEAALDKSNNELNDHIPLIIAGMPPQSAYKVLLYVIMLTKETSLVATAYKCRECGKSTLFDLDPDVPVPPQVEKDRAFMEDFLDFLSERVDRKASRNFVYKVKHPYKIENLPAPDDLEEGKTWPEDLTIYRMKVNFPGINSYIKALRDENRAQDAEMWVLYENLVSVNDLSEEETAKLKSINGFEKILRMRIDDLRGLTEQLNDSGVDINHVWDCVHCGNHSDREPFDLTNFFESLTSMR